jgi:small subunit ribosomal protein S8
MLIQIKNAGAVGKESVVIPFSKFKHEIAKVLANKGYIKGVSLKGKNPKRVLEVELAYNGRAHRIQGVSRVSKPSRRVYQAAKTLRPVRNGYGTTIVSTPKGVLVAEDARKAHVGGEVLFIIW